ncbi:DUF5695 domain-containing protein [Acetobacter persici]|uniref:DUF5695 domain-containing protein n=1 Tax=Acetobacter persici TaxID=1076596 RepID=UPI001BA57910|nr:hypothetical protein [Acetobacter persici]
MRRCFAGQAGRPTGRNTVSGCMGFRIRMLWQRVPCALILAGLGGAGLVGPLSAFAQGGAAVGQSDKSDQSVFHCDAAKSLTLCNAGPFFLRFQASDGTLRALSALTDKDADYLPWRIEGRRQGNGFAHLGDIDFRLKTEGETGWQDYASWHVRQPVTQLRTQDGGQGSVLRRDDMSASLGHGFPLQVIRAWRLSGQDLVLEFSVTNPGKQTVTVGGLGIPLVFGNDFTDETLEEAHRHEVFADPAIARDGGYIQVTRMSGAGPVLLGVPEGHTSLEAYRPIMDAPHAVPGANAVLTDGTPRSQTFEGFYDWMPASAGFAGQEWKKAGAQWNTPTQFSLHPGETRSFGIRFTFAPGVRGIEKTLAEHARPVAVSLPGYVVPQDLPATLFLQAPLPVRSFSVEPEGALSLVPEGTRGVWQRYRVEGRAWGRARLSVTYADGSVQTLNYFVTHPARTAAEEMGRFLFSRQWYENPADPFHRSPSIMTYDREAGHIVTQEPRVWIAGLSDEGGAGSYVAAAMKELDNPDPQEVAKLERFVNETVTGRLQVASGPTEGGVRKSLFYYDPVHFPDFYKTDENWKTWASWSREKAADIQRAYNYPHVALVHWVLYRLARNHPGLVQQHDALWYLHKAAVTMTAMMQQAPYYTQYGLMEGDVFVEILRDLKRENLTEEAGVIETLMKKRETVWKGQRYPYGSEMAWDSTGQPEVYAWLTYFGDTAQAAETRDAILAYDPALPSWGYNGNARRYWDFLYAGKRARIERQIHHYGSALNAVPLFSAFQAQPPDLYMLRVAYGGLMGALTNIDQQGFGSAAFHSAPDAMQFDAYSGDYGMGFYGHALATQVDVIKDPTFGWQAFGALLQEGRDSSVTILPKDSARTRIFIAQARVFLTLESGKFEAVTYHPASQDIEVTLAAADRWTPVARLRVDYPAGVPAHPYVLNPAAPDVRGAWEIPLHSMATVLHLHAGRP